MADGFILQNLFVVVYCSVSDNYQNNYRVSGIIVRAVVSKFQIRAGPKQYLIWPEFQLCSNNADPFISTVDLKKRVTLIVSVLLSNLLVSSYSLFSNFDVRYY